MFGYIIVKEKKDSLQIQPCKKRTLPLHEAIKGLLHEHETGSGLGVEMKMKQFIKDFDSGHSLIIYHNNLESKQEDTTHAKDVKHTKEHKQGKLDKKN
ncbi:hypothetical protein J1N35_004511 [Gossypium stocksii]|uniref:Uncharacterized protein n=1 Tax=Gossypium stocksii TaxID=47602 RepID=A0A9D3WCA9_9ROSI|nr:hypothetical protein J1N35_004511 [Gossypium stocksii]